VFLRELVSMALNAISKRRMARDWPVIAAKGGRKARSNPHRPGEQNCHDSDNALVCRADEVKRYINQVGLLQRRRIS